MGGGWGWGTGSVGGGEGGGVGVGVGVGAVVGVFLWYLLFLLVLCVFMTPSGVQKDRPRASDFFVLDRQGTVLSQDLVAQCG